MFRLAFTALPDDVSINFKKKKDYIFFSNTPLVFGIR